MNLENLRRISFATENACAVVLQRPDDHQAREQLFIALAEVVDPAFQAEEKAAYHATDLIPEARVWADIVRTRISLAQTSPLPDASAVVRAPAQHLLTVLSDLARECTRLDEEGRRFSVA
jgi:hypothetical protein